MFVHRKPTLTQRRVTRHLKKLNKSLKSEGKRVVAIPYSSSSPEPLTELDDLSQTEYWKFVLKEDSKEGTPFVTVHKENSREPVLSSLEGTVHALLQPQILGMYDITQKQRKQLMNVVNKLTRDKVYQTGHY